MFVKITNAICRVLPVEYPTNATSPGAKVVPARGVVVTDRVAVGVGVEVSVRVLEPVSVEVGEEVSVMLGLTLNVCVMVEDPTAVATSV